MVKLTPSLVYVRTKTSVENVTKLNLWGCEVDDIDLCSQMPKLNVLSLSVNKVSSLEPLQHCLALEELYIRKNKIEDLNEIRHLSGLPKLRVLWIEENPCTENAAYRNKIIQMLPQLTHLDNVAIAKDTSSTDVEDPVQPPPPPIVDTVIPPSTATISLGCQAQLTDSPVESSASEEEERPHPTMTQSLIYNPINRTKSLMNTSVIGSFNIDDREREVIPGWEDFVIEEEDPEPQQQPCSSMFQSFHEGFRRSPRGYPGTIYVPGRPMNRKRFSARSQSMSPARTQRFENIISAVGVMLDELDQDGLRRVVDEAQRRIKKKH